MQRSLQRLLNSNCKLEIKGRPCTSSRKKSCVFSPTFSFVSCVKSTAKVLGLSIAYVKVWSLASNSSTVSPITRKWSEAKSVIKPTKSFLNSSRFALAYTCINRSTMSSTFCGSIFLKFLRSVKFIYIISQGHFTRPCLLEYCAAINFS